MSIIKKENYPYMFDTSACYSCGGRCCTGESGYIFVTKTEADKICKLLGIDIQTLMKEYLYKKDYRYSIRENKIGESYECVFYSREINGCQIYKAKPNQCSTFPFWDYYKTRVDELKLECPGVIDAKS